MSVIPITIFFSLLLAGIFVVLFAREQRRRFGSAERDSLLPLADEAPVEDGARAPHGSKGRGAQVPPPGRQARVDHDHGDGRCGCADGARPPCAGCAKQFGRAAAAAPLS